MPRTSDARERILDAAAQLFRRQGYAGTGLKELVAEGQAPWGSLYHYFPGGKEQLAEEALLRSGKRYEKLVDIVFERSPDLPAAIVEFYGLAAQALERSGYGDGCPIGTVTVEVAATNETLREACAQVFDGWVEKTATRFREAGLPARRAAPLAELALVTLEGAIMLSRAAHDTAPLRRSAASIAAVVEQELRAFGGEAGEQTPAGEGRAGRRRRARPS